MTHESSQGQRVSVIIPTYNRARLIGETIESVIRQTHQNLELIIIDDGSTDETWQVIRSFSDSRITYFKTNHSGSFGVVRNLGIQKSTGDFIAFLDSDDIWEKGKIEKQLSILREGKYAFCFTHIRLFGETNVVAPDYKTLQGKLLNLYLKEGHFAFYPSSLMFSRKALEKTGLLSEETKFGADAEFFVSLCHHFDGAFIAERLVNIRKHERNTSTSAPLFGYAEMIALVQKIYRNGYIPKPVFTSTISKLYYKMGLDQYGRGESRKAAGNFFLFSTHRPLHLKGWIRQLQALIASIR
jgi:glycosyltransferase involved in cell wall biosynthesis